MDFNINKTRDIKLNVKPIATALYHEYVFEGPCRFVGGEKLKKAYDLKVNAENFARFDEALQNAMPTEEVNLLEPVHIEINETFRMSDAQMAEITRDAAIADFYVFSGGGGEALLSFAHKYRKPIAVMGTCVNVATNAALTARGLEVYYCETWDDLTETTKVLRVRKALAETKVLLLNRLNSNIATNMVDSFISLEEVTAKLGTRFKYFNIHEFMDQTHNVPSDSNPTTPGRREANITDADEVEISRMTDEFIAGAMECDMKHEDVYPSMKAHYLVNKLLEQLECNAFAAPCQDICATRRLNEERFTFCLNHSLNNENGVSSACEYAITALLSMVLLSNAAKAPAYMGNTIPNPIKNGTLAALTKTLLNPNTVAALTAELGDMENLVFTWHSVPNRKLKGYDTKNAPYSIRPFTYSGWGATVRYDFAADKGQKITMCCFDPTCSKLFVAGGTIVSGIGYGDINCSEGVLFEVNDSRDFFQKMCQVGNHIPLVYGDCFDRVVKVGKALGLEVLTV